jgi:hypothetical protein|tara:strand:- start:63405 stop:64505 length:1101 start_codon:yes stop_codon:yes gene_type:complete
VIRIQKAVVILYSIPIWISLPAQAGPKLHMHVFEEKTVSDVSAPSPQERKLTLHVFDPTTSTSSKVNSNGNKIISQNTSFNAPSPAHYKSVNMYIKTGYQRDDFAWNIAGPTGVPNILSELTWKDIEIATISIGGDVFLKDQWLTQAEFSYGKIWDGESQASVYSANNRTMETFRSKNRADEGYIYDMSANLAYKYPAYIQQQHSLFLVPKLGFSYHKQHLKIVDGKQTIPFEAGIANLDSSYETTWYGPWFGLSSEYSHSDKYQFQLGVEYHYAFYDAEASWESSGLQGKFEHEARGSGWIYNASADYKLQSNLSLGIELIYEDWLADKNGKDSIYSVDGNDIALEFNEAERTSFTANLKLNYEF